ncbi:MAG: hypothetical protein ETSY1_40170 [Candidatus Entotheonella factor]|uniref:Uncharacterized protein n=1 Tax=Entotheonella factor TaxID=1429438 RepID=W4L542_ENTF1|nr:hypothetical protein [Candidatus Entotheonella palauensis]ETW93218.1 MAG: hypothetical protein ETSY1_40170 [Candidatus Entotheonella factor]
MTPLTATLLLLIGMLTVAIVAVAQRKRMKREARCPHCCVRKHYYVGYVNTGHTDAQEQAPVRCKSCQLLFMVPG